MQKNNLHINIKEAFDSAKETAPTDVWTNIAEALRKRKRRRFLILIFILGFTIIGSSFLYYTINSYSKNKQEKYFRNKTMANDIPKIYAEPKKLDVTKIDEAKIRSSTAQGIKVSTKPATIIYNKFSAEDKNDICRAEKNKFKSDAKYEIKIKKSDFEEDIPQENIKAVTALEPEIEEVESIDLYPIQKVGSQKNNENTAVLKNGKVVEAQNENSNVKNNRGKKEKKKQKWDKYLSLSYNALIVGENNIFIKDNAEKSLQASANLNNPGVQIFNLPKTYPIYNTGKEISLAVFFKNNNEHKKINTQLGLQASYSNYSNKVYATVPGAVVDVNGNLNLSFNDPSNSFYSTRANTNNSSITIKNNYFSVGVLFGLQTNLFKLNINQHLVLQAQVIPTLNISKSINWYQESTERYFKDKSFNRQLNVSQSTAILWQVNTKKIIFLVGPNFNYHFLPLNLKKTNLGSVYSSSIGLTTQINF